jgi:hypothetical protein
LRTERSGCSSRLSIVFGTAFRLRRRSSQVKPVVPIRGNTSEMLSDDERARRSQSRGGTGGSRMTVCERSRTRVLAVTSESNSHLGKVPLWRTRWLRPTGLCLSPRHGDRKGNGAIIQERFKGAIRPFDDRKDVISKPGNEQHLFTKRPKY